MAVARLTSEPRAQRRRLVAPLVRQAKPLWWPTETSVRFRSAMMLPGSDISPVAPVSTVVNPGSWRCGPNRPTIASMGVVRCGSLSRRDEAGAEPIYLP
jgi:hypothetical protein